MTVQLAGEGPGSAAALLRATRPRQWIKNLLVLAAPALAGELGDISVVWNSALAFVAFSLAASGIYLVNDVRDIHEDRAHPAKRLRPVAAGQLSTRLAVRSGVALLLGALAVAIVADAKLLAVVATYEVALLLYCLVLKDEPVVDIAIIAAGFLLRAVAGGAASDIELSRWFLLAASFGSLFMAAGKRYAELTLLGEGQSATRRSLHHYTESYLRFVWSVSAGILIMTYGLWAFEMSDATDSPWAVISMAPFVLAVLRYAVHVDEGRGGEPEEIALSDRVLQSLCLVWLVLVALAVAAR